MLEKVQAARTGMLSNPELWNRICEAPLPSTRDGSDFARALANLNDMPLSDAREVEREYRRFLYLAASSDAPRVPPLQVRQAWELHASSPEYPAFCAGVMGRALPIEDSTRMLGANRAYLRTRADYMREFGQKPQRFIWPDGVSPRMPRWLGAHVTSLGLTGAVAWSRDAPLVLAAGLAVSLALYGFDLWSSHRRRLRTGLGEAMTSDLDYWLQGVGR
jgi:hypothetical protein